MHIMFGGLFILAIVGVVMLTLKFTKRKKDEN